MLPSLLPCSILSIHPVRRPPSTTGLEARLRRIPSICSKTWWPLGRVMAAKPGPRGCCLRQQGVPSGQSMGQAEQGLQQSAESQKRSKDWAILQGKAAGIFSSYGETIPMSFYLKKNMSQKHVCPCKVLEKSMPQTIDSSSKNDMYIMDFPTAHHLRHKKTTAAQVTTLTLYNYTVCPTMAICLVET